MNIVCLMGRLTADPELRHTANGVPVTSFMVAVDRTIQPKNAPERVADFLPVAAWRGTAEFITRYFRKGQRIALQGELQSRPFTDKEGNKRTAYEVVAQHAFFTALRGAPPRPPARDRPPSLRGARPLQRRILKRSCRTTICRSEGVAGCTPRLRCRESRKGKRGRGR